MNNYHLQLLIGEGSFGRVYKATEKKNDKIVALKVIAKRGRTHKEIENFRGECEIQHHLSHPNIIQILHSFETDNEIVVVTEYAPSDLHQLLGRQKCITEDRARRLTHQLLSALYYLHSHRILHRDLKPQNILLDGDERAKLCDFGLARNMTMGTHVLTSIKGTPLYMAPELMSEKPYDHLADLWSLGCIIYETMAGGPPFCANSFIRLVKIIRHQNVPWPSFLSADCISFLQGLLQKDPADRLPWTSILQHPFVRGHLTILNEPAASSPFTHPLSQSQCLAKERQLNNLANRATHLKQPLAAPSLVDISKHAAAAELLTTSQDSVHAILQSDIENVETDAEDAMSLYTANRQQLAPMGSAGLLPPTATGYAFGADLCFVSGNSNLIVTNLNDNFLVQQQMQQSRVWRNKELEKRKLSQNLENFSVRLGGSKGRPSSVQRSLVVGDVKHSVDVKAIHSRESKEISVGATLKEPPQPGLDTSIAKEMAAPNSQRWDSCDEQQNPPIENEEWMAFLQRSMQEVLEGELDSFKQQNLASIVVAPLRNVRASARVIECVSQLLSLPLVVDVSLNDMMLIRSVYLEVKLVPNLVYASKLLCSVRTQDTELSTPVSKIDQVDRQVYKQANQITTSERKTLLSLYELICHLVHLNDQQYLTQFCDAVDILGASELLANLLVIVSEDGIAIRLTNCVLGLLCFALREQPENAELVVEKVMFHSNVSLSALLSHRNDMLKTRMCRMLRMLGRFSCCALQNVWTPAMNIALEALLNDPIEQIRNETKHVMGEFEHLSFYKEMRST